jgi:hypothetical protein
MDGACVDTDLTVLLDSVGLTQFVASATREDSLQDVFASSDPTTVSNGMWTMQDSSLITAW